MWPPCPTAEAEVAEGVAQRLLDVEERKRQTETDLESLEEQLKQATARSQMADSELQ